MTDRQRNLLIGALIIFIVGFVLVNGGDTVSIVNHSINDVCEVHFSFSPEEDGWGKNRISSYIRHGHSRDIRLPLYWGWFKGDANGYQGRMVDCTGETIYQVDGLGMEGNFAIWEIK